MTGPTDPNADPLGRPECERCGSRTDLARLEPHLTEPRTDVRIYECPKCGAEKVEIVKLDG